MIRPRLTRRPPDMTPGAAGWCLAGPPHKPERPAGKDEVVKHTRVVVTHYGGPDALQVLEEECPEPQDDEARVRVLAAGVSLPDVMAREGVHPEAPPVPFTPGWDLVGVVDRLGDGVAGIEPGQTVAALPIHGALLCARQDTRRSCSRRGA